LASKHHRPEKITRLKRSVAPKRCPQNQALACSSQTEIQAGVSTRNVFLKPQYPIGSGHDRLRSKNQVSESQEAEMHIPTRTQPAVGFVFAAR